MLKEFAMMKTGILSLALTLGVALCTASGASAQLNNRPFTPTFQGGGAIGMSSAYREAILRQKLFGETPSNLVRSRSGNELLDVQRLGNQAFLSSRSSSFVSPRAQIGGFATYNTGLGGFSFGSSGPIQWIAALGNEGLSWNSLAGGGNIDTPINAWISQLDGPSASGSY